MRLGEVTVLEGNENCPENDVPAIDELGAMLDNGDRFFTWSSLFFNSSREDPASPWLLKSSLFPTDENEKEEGTCPTDDDGANEEEKVVGAERVDGPEEEGTLKPKRCWISASLLWY